MVEKVLTSRPTVVGFPLLLIMRVFILSFLADRTGDTKLKLCTEMGTVSSIEFATGEHESDEAPQICASTVVSCWFYVNNKTCLDGLARF